MQAGASVKNVNPRITVATPKQVTFQQAVGETEMQQAFTAMLT